MGLGVREDVIREHFYDGLDAVLIDYVSNRESLLDRRIGP